MFHQQKENMKLRFTQVVGYINDIKTINTLFSMVKLDKVDSLLLC